MTIGSLCGIMKKDKGSLRPELSKNSYSLQKEGEDGIQLTQALL